MTFNNTCYLINWSRGTGGAFVTSLVYNFVFGDFDLLLSKYGNAHSGLAPVNDTFKISPNYRINEYPIYHFAKPVSKKNPVILYDHVVPNYNIISSIFPNFYNIVLTIDKADYLLASALLFLKIVKEEWPDNSEPWEATKKLWMNDFPKIKQKIKILKSPNDIPKDILEYVFPTPDKNNYTTINTVDFYFKDYKCKKKYKDRVFKISASDLRENPKYVLSYLSDITQKPITNNIKENYKNYLTKQKNIISNHIPWYEKHYYFNTEF